MYFLSIVETKHTLFFLATKHEKLLQKRYAEFLKYPAVTKTITLPMLLPTGHGQSKSELSFSVSDGMKWKVRKKKRENIASDITLTIDKHFRVTYPRALGRGSSEHEYEANATSSFANIQTDTLTEVSKTYP